jgi:UDP-3-O-[3-hydroxymyristoyl] glucosamine N-acyltransferase
VQGRQVVREGRRTIELGELVDTLGGELHGSRSLVVRQVAPLGTACADHIAYLGSELYRRLLPSSKAGAVIVSRGVVREGAAYVVADNPYAYFIQVARLLNPELPPNAGIHPLATVSPGARISASAEIGPFVSIGEGAHVAERVKIGPGCHIGEYATIGPDSFLHANVCVYAHCSVGARAVINAGAVIGADGFGGAMVAGRWLKMPHVGRVVIGDDVEIGANTTIDRGAMADTVIGDDVKLDNQIQIGHNVHIGAHTTIAGCVGIAGSAKIGEHCVIGGAAMISGHLSIADHVQISLGTVVMSSIDEPGRYTGFYPIATHRAWMRSAARLRRLGEREASRAEQSSVSVEPQGKDTDEHGH